MRLPPLEGLFPRRSRCCIAWFWAWYWLTFFAFLPWMLARQVGVSFRDVVGHLRTRGRSYRFLQGDLEIAFLGGLDLVPIVALFGERLTALRYRDVVIDPGPPAARTAVLAQIRADQPSARTPGPLAAVVATHFHEEHLGNAAAIARRAEVPVFATACTLAALRQPAELPGGRRLLMGQPEAAVDVRQAVLEAELVTPRTRLAIIDAPGHCDGHIALFDAEHGILFAGDSFLHQIFTAPNRDSSAAPWIATLDRFAALPVRTLVGAHGAIISSDPALPVVPGVVQRGDPQALIRGKRDFLVWAKRVVAEGQRRGLPASVIEATLFPWSCSWSWRTWFHDESFRLFTCGEFSRTWFVRSLAADPATVPPRFGGLVALGERLAVAGPELLRIHLLALRPVSVLIIALSILVSLAVVLGCATAAAGAELWPATSGKGLGERAAAFAAALGAALPLLLRPASLPWLAVASVLLVAWWAVIGGAVTRRMGLALHGQGESLLASLRFCLKPGLLVPSALASLCFGFVLVAPTWPWLLVPLLPVWLCAGFLYAPLTLRRVGLRQAWAALRTVAAHPGPLLRRQLLFLLGFAVSTGVVWCAAGLWIASCWGLAGLWPDAALGMTVLAAPAALYALGYTTANLKSLQLWLASTASSAPDPDAC